MTNGTKVLKRDGQTESLNLEKVHKMTEEACEGLAGVSASQVEIQSGIQFYDGITTAEIQEHFREMDQHKELHKILKDNNIGLN